MNISYDSPYGIIQSSWLASTGTTTWNVTIPPNTTARLALTKAQVEQYAVDGSHLSAVFS